MKPPPPEACPGAWQAPLLTALVVERFILLTVLSSQRQLKPLSSSSVSGPQTLVGIRTRELLKTQMAGPHPGISHLVGLGGAAAAAQAHTLRASAPQGPV